MSVEITYLEASEYIYQGITVKDDYLLTEMILEAYIDVSVESEDYINQIIIVEDSE